jgi:hypothetical protein
MPFSSVVVNLNDELISPGLREALPWDRRSNIPTSLKGKNRGCWGLLIPFKGRADHRQLAQDTGCLRQPPKALVALTYNRQSLAN